MQRNLLIAGGSVRAAAESAIRAGFTPWCVDCFGDADLVRACPTRVVHDYPTAIPEMLASGPDGGWMYTGALENHPEILAAVDRPLCGNSSAVVRQVRDPQKVYEVLTAARLPVPRLDPTDVGRWLLKPCRSGGGIGIRFWNGESFDRSRFYLQEWIDGLPMSVTYLADAARCEVVGVTEMLVGLDWLHAPGPFHYCGSLRSAGPVGVRLVELGEALHKAFGLRGLFGVDGVVNLSEGNFYPVEVNPRYTASMEIVERTTGRNLVSEHVRIFTEGTFPEVPRGLIVGHGKAILYSPDDFAFPEEGPWNGSALSDAQVSFADIPAAGQRILRGQPVLTFFAKQSTPFSTERALRKIAGDLDRLLFGR